MDSKLTRRYLLRLSVLAGSAALLQACSPSAPPAATTAPAAPKPTDPPKPASTTAPAAAPPAAPAAQPTTAPAPAAAATTAPPAAKPATAGGTLTPLWGQTLAHINPLQTVTNAQFQYHATVLSSLMQPSPDKTRFDPELAEVTVAPDSSSYTFKINPTAKWHDGRPLTAEDVEFTYTLALNKATK